MTEDDIARIYDARLVSVDNAAGTVIFAAANVIYLTQLSVPAAWKLDAVGLLHLQRNLTSFKFDVYPDQRLRRVPERDRLQQQTWCLADR
jgi:hypothetical protein